MAKPSNTIQPPAIPDILQKAREDFPILKRTVNGKPLVYLDNGASTQKPQAVIDVLNRYYSNENSNIHRGVHLLSVEATSAYEEARHTITDFIGANDDSEIIFTRGTTESVNLVAHSFVEPQIQAGDEILITHMEHHANIVPWQLLCERTGAILKVAPIDENGALDLEAFKNLLSEKTKLASFVHVSNAIGVINPVAEMIAAAKEKGVPTLLDAAQSIQHMPLNVKELDCDFLAFSGHKIFAPTGIGVLYGKRALLDEMRPYQGGGDMISTVSFEGTTFKEPPSRFEAGTPHIAGAIGLKAAIDYLQSIGLETIARYEEELLKYATVQLRAIDGLRIIGNPAKRAGAISFVMENAHSHDVGTILDTEGVAIRSGHHCCEPLMKRLGVSATTRASFSFYNNHTDVDTLVSALKKVSILFE
ncbi:cysteine desulfurase [Puniceicoccaceae bacterium K14]|nr:cysteine desulfurase [Puniceicoccaceae bacterium K14]